MSDARYYIEIHEPQILEDRCVKSKISCSPEVGKYLDEDVFYATYSRNIGDVNPCILQIPAISNLVTLAWAVGADIHVEQIDGIYLESLAKIKTVLEKMYPGLPYSTEIYVDKVVWNSFSYEGMGLLFSGGLDSTTSFIRHREANPHLITVWGADIPIWAERFWQQVAKRNKGFATSHGVNISFVKTNMCAFLNYTLLGIDFGRYLSDGSWWAGIQHGLGLLGLCAPLTIAEHIGTLVISSTHSADFAYMWGSHPLIDNHVSWAGVKVVHDGYDLTRQEKIKALNDYIENTGDRPELRVCHSQCNDVNCGECEKCFRTIAGLVLEGVDPNECGFKVYTSAFDLMKRSLAAGELKLGDDEAFMWKDIQAHIPTVVEHNLYDSEPFFSWLRSIDVEDLKDIRRQCKQSKRYQVWSWLRGCYSRLPRKVRRGIRRCVWPYIAKIRDLVGG